MTPSGFQHPKCYARALGGCSERISTEHFVSESVLKHVGGPRFGNPSVYGRNLAFQRSSDKKLLDIGRLTSGILCTRHNSDLSPFDTAGKAIAEAAEDLHLAMTDPSRTASSVRIRGDDFERWMLKTLCSSLYSGKMWRDLAVRKGVCPTIEWLKCLFQDAPFPAGQGIFWQPTEIEGLTAHDWSELEFHPLMSLDGQQVGGMRVWLFGLRFDLVAANLDPDPLSPYSPDRYRPGRVQLFGRSDSIRFDWKTGLRSQRILIGAPAVSGTT